VEDLLGDVARRGGLKQHHRRACSGVGGYPCGDGVKFVGEGDVEACGREVVEALCGCRRLELPEGETLVVVDGPRVRGHAANTACMMGMSRRLLSPFSWSNAASPASVLVIATQPRTASLSNSMKCSSTTDPVVETDSAHYLSSTTTMISSKRASIGSRISPNRDSIQPKISPKLD
jgi:hypothetical protein